MDHPVTDAPPLVTDQPDEFEALRLAVGRMLIAILGAARVRDLSPAQAAARLELIAEVFEKGERTHGPR